MSYDPSDTICAIANAAGGAARGMVRVSGSQATDVVAKLFRPAGGESLHVHRRPIAVSGSLLLELTPGDLRSLPCELFLWPTSRSYTREPVAELHTLGAPPLLDTLLATLCRAGARLAEPGEFTLRAFLAGRIDLTQAEAVLGVIDARGDAELDAALQQLAGGLAQPLSALRNELLQLLAELEAGLDFVEEDIEFLAADELRARLATAAELLAGIASQMASRSTAGMPRVVLVGRPNVGKSSLFNALILRYGAPGDERQTPSRAALVSARAGTTRDYLTATIEVNGVRCELIDTAGIDENPSLDQALHVRGLPNSSYIDDAANRLATARRADASLRVRCIDASESGAAMTEMSYSQNELVALTKCDLAAGGWSADDRQVLTSSRTGEGLDRLAAEIGGRLLGEVPEQGLAVHATASRCRESLRLARGALASASALAASDGGHELIAAELRHALTELGKVVGAIYTDDLLDRIFSTFCIGK